MRSKIRLPSNDGKATGHLLEHQQIWICDSRELNAQGVNHAELRYSHKFACINTVDTLCTTHFPEG